MMKEYSIGYGQLMDIPYSKYLEFGKIISIESREEKKRQEKMEREMDKKV